MRTRRIALVSAVTLSVLSAALAPSPGAATTAHPAATTTPPITKAPVAVGRGGAVSTVDADATAVGIEVLREGGNAVDAAVAAAATLGVTEPYSAGLGGGGFFVFYDARTHRVHTIDGRETAPAAFREDSFVENGQAIAFPDAVYSGLSVGVPGTPLTWQEALRLWGTRSLRDALRPAAAVARRGFVVDQTFHDQTAQNVGHFTEFPATRALFLPDGQPPPVGSVFRNPDLAATYDEVGRHGVQAVYSGPIGADIVRTVQHPPVDPAVTRVVRKGLMTGQDLRAYSAPLRTPTHVSYRGLDVYSMAPPSSGGSTVGEALNILENFDLAGQGTAQFLHHYLEASRLAFADRNRYVGDPGYVDVPLAGLLSKGFARERACLIDPTHALASPVAPGSLEGDRTGCQPAAAARAATPYEGLATTNLEVTDRWGNVVSYTLTIEQTGGSAITVPGRGFLLNNELTDFNFAPLFAGVPDPNLPAGGKRPRSSMAPTIVLRAGVPYLAVGSPGGASIITTVLQTLLNRLDRGRTLPEAIAAPRASQRNSASTQAEPGFLALPELSQLTALGQVFTSIAEIGAATAIEFLGRGRLLAAAEPVRRGGGSAAVVRPG